MSGGANGYVSYAHTGWGAEQGEREKRASWEDKGAIERRREVSAHDVEFVPFTRYVASVGCNTRSTASPIDTLIQYDCVFWLLPVEKVTIAA